LITFQKALKLSQKDYKLVILHILVSTGLMNAHLPYLKKDEIASLAKIFCHFLKPKFQIYLLILRPLTD